MFLHKEWNSFRQPVAALIISITRHSEHYNDFPLTRAALYFAAEVKAKNFTTVCTGNYGAGQNGLLNLTPWFKRDGLLNLYIKLLFCKNTQANINNLQDFLALFALAVEFRVVVKKSKIKNFSSCKFLEAIRNNLNIQKTVHQWKIAVSSDCSFTCVV